MLHAPPVCTWLPNLSSTPLTANLHFPHLPIRRPLLAIQRQAALQPNCRPQLLGQQSVGKCCAWGRGKRQPEVPKTGSNSTGPSQADSDVNKASNQFDKQQSEQQSQQRSTRQTSQQRNGQSSRQGSLPSSTTASNSGNLPNADRPKHRRDTNWEDWEDWDSDWEAPDDNDAPPDQFRKRNPRRGMGYGTPRDEYLRPMIDTLGIQYRLGFKQMEAEERVQTEFETNQWESREAVKFGGDFCCMHHTVLSVSKAVSYLALSRHVVELHWPVPSFADLGWVVTCAHVKSHRHTDLVAPYVHNCPTAQASSLCKPRIRGCNVLDHLAFWCNIACCNCLLACHCLFMSTNLCIGRPEHSTSKLSVDVCMLLESPV